MQKQVGQDKTNYNIKQSPAIHTIRRPTPVDIERAWVQAQTESLPRPVLDLAHSNTNLFERFAQIYPQLCARPRRARRSMQRTLGTSLAGVALAMALGHAPSAEAATITVNTTVPGVVADGFCSLAEAINNANSDAQSSADCPAGSGADTIVLSTGTYPLTAADNNGSGCCDHNGLPIVTTAITIEGNGATITRDTGSPTTAPYFRFFRVAATGDITLNDTTLTNGYATEGGAIFNLGSVELNRSTLTANRGCYGQINSGQTGSLNPSLTINSSTVSDNGIDCGKTGGGLFVLGGELTLHNSTVSGNTNGRAAGIYAIGTIDISHSTITGNIGAQYGSGLFVGGSYPGSPTTLAITHSIISGNVATFPSPFRNGIDVYSRTDAVTSGYNLFGQDGLTTAVAVDGFTPAATDIFATSDGSVPTALAGILGPLADNGGPTPTHALVTGSPAIDAGGPGPCPLPTDQRGISRPQSGACDIGSFEVEAPDADGDGVADSNDLCPGTAAGASVDANGCSAAQVDGDNDGICDPGAASSGPSACTGSDNCPVDANPGQADTDGDTLGNACDDDDDGDNWPDGVDNCPLVANPTQDNADGDTEGDACDADDDNDGVLDGPDNCPLLANPGQEDNENDGIGDICDPNDDNDPVADFADNCPFDDNGGQEDNDNDGMGDVCDADDDNDGVPDVADNCPIDANPGQEDDNNDNVGNVCDADSDGVPNSVDNCTLVVNPAQRDTDGDGFGNFCDADFDNNGIVNLTDLALMKQNFFLTTPNFDLDGDGTVNFVDLNILKTSFFLPPGPSASGDTTPTTTTTTTATSR